MAELRKMTRIIPALAGNTTSGSWGDNVPKDHPRSRGEYSGERVSGIRVDGSSPLSRGIHVRDTDPHRKFRIIPALAGNTRSQ